MENQAVGVDYSNKRNEVMKVVEGLSVADAKKILQLTIESIDRNSVVKSEK